MRIHLKSTVPIAILLAMQVCRTAAAQELSAVAAVERTSVFVGETFIFQVQVSGSEQPEQPDVSAIEDFSVEFQGGRRNSSSSVTITNGRMTQNVKRGYIFSYQLVAQQAGTFTIPSIAVQAAGKTVRTHPVEIRVQKPAETDDFKLRLTLSTDQAYVGEPVTLTVTWYLGQDVRGFSMSLPLLDNTDAFYMIDPEVDTNSGAKFYRLPLGAGEVIAEQGGGRLDGKEFTTLSFSKVLIPKHSGSIAVEPATVVCEALAGYRESQRRSLFGGDPFSQMFDDDFFNMGRQGVYQKVVTPSNALELQIKDVPAEGRPANFAGHVGQYRIQAEAGPLDVKVGDPLTLTLTLSGPEYLDHITLPPLTDQSALVNDFKIPTERAMGETRGSTKVFTQSIRALRPDIQVIPPIELPYFDTKTGRYEVARTDPIPITVATANVVTVLDAEGREIPVSTKSEVETWAHGIAYNYEDAGVLINQRSGLTYWLQSPLWLGIIAAPPAVYLLLLCGFVIVRKRNADPLAARAKTAYRRLTTALNSAESNDATPEAFDLLLQAFRAYLGDKLRMPPGALMFQDVRAALAKQGVTPEQLQILKSIFDRCEASRYAGPSTDDAANAELFEQARRLAAELEKLLK